jgi:hypothetical protein
MRRHAWAHRTEVCDLKKIGPDFFFFEVSIKVVFKTNLICELIIFLAWRLTVSIGRVTRLLKYKSVSFVLLLWNPISWPGTSGRCQIILYAWKTSPRQSYNVVFLRSLYLKVRFISCLSSSNWVSGNWMTRNEVLERNYYEPYSDIPTVFMRLRNHVGNAQCPNLAIRIFHNI